VNKKRISESKYRLRIFLPQRWGLDFAHACCLPSFIGKTYANMRKEYIVYILFYVFKLFKFIERPANCEIRPVFRFLMARNVNPTDIDHQICELCVENSMSVGMVRKWVRKVNEGYDNVQEEKRSGRP
jgi:hypothetical protein